MKIDKLSLIFNNFFLILVDKLTQVNLDFSIKRTVPSEKADFLSFYFFIVGQNSARRNS